MENMKPPSSCVTLEMTAPASKNRAAPRSRLTRPLPCLVGRRGPVRRLLGQFGELAGTAGTAGLAVEPPTDLTEDRQLHAAVGVHRSRRRSPGPGRGQRHDRVMTVGPGTVAVAV